MLLLLNHRVSAGDTYQLGGTQTNLEVASHVVVVSQLTFSASLKGVGVLHEFDKLWYSYAYFLQVGSLVISVPPQHHCVEELYSHSQTLSDITAR